MLVYQIQKFIGSYVAALNGVDAIVFTAGLGENQDTLRERICTNMEYLGIKFDHEATRAFAARRRRSPRRTARSLFTSSRPTKNLSLHAIRKPSLKSCNFT